MADQVFIEGGARRGKTLQNEAAIRAAIAEGKAVITKLNGVWFSATISEDGAVSYQALPRKPEGL